MGTKYSNNLPTGYNVSPPSDDGATTAANKVQWSTIKTKLTDCFNTWASALNTAILNAFDTSSSSLTGNYTTLASDNARTLQCSGTFTVSLGDASTLAAGWFCNIVNAGTGTITIGRATGGNTLGGVASNVTLAPLQATTVIVNQAANGFNLLDCNSPIIDPTDTTKQARFDVSGVTTGNTSVLKVSPAQVVEGIQGANIVSGATVNLDTATGDYVHITGTTTITAFTLTQGRTRKLIFDGILTLTNNASIITGTGQNVTTAAGDSIIVTADAANVVRVLAHNFAAGDAASQGSSLVLLSNQSASNSATMDFDSVITNAYDDYELKFNAVVPATNAASLLFRVSTNNGSTFLAGTEYNGSRLQNTASASAPAGGADSSAANLTICNSISNGSSGAWGTIAIKRLNGGVCAIQWQASWVDNSGIVETSHGGGIINATSMNAVRLLMSSGNVTSGTFRLYGLKNT